ncbi:MAG: alkaline phosphatase family protein [Nitrospirota bacterium]|nr:alkaline phosphatase family protein [Nitrospirota bacterium]
MKTSSGVRHIVVLMLENRSFDHMLGYLKKTDQDLEGLTGSESNPTDPALSDQGPVEQVLVSKLSGTQGYVTDPDPAHEYPDVTLQIFGQVPPPSPPVPENDGFVLSYSGVPDSNGVPCGVAVGKTIMACFDPLLQLPVLATLAREFVLCDHWFSSVPGPTWPNRFFVHSATSGGHTNSPSSLSAVKDELGFSTYGMRTIYDSLSEQDIGWNIYYHDFPQSLALTNLHSRLDRFKNFGTFLSDVASGTLPAYSFIEPRYFDGIDGKANDQHPPHDVREGERLIATVYEALRKNPSLFAQTLLVVLYDEHGGYFDHVPPPTAINPDGRISDDSPPFAFDRLGVRVPALLISPLVGPGVIDHAVYDHTSLLATVKKVFGLPRFLTKRDASANTFESRFTGQSLRDPSGMPDLSAYADGSAPFYAALHPSLSHRAGSFTPFQQSLIDLSHQLNLRTEADGSVHLAQQLDAFRAKQGTG